MLKYNDLLIMIPYSFYPLLRVCVCVHEKSKFKLGKLRNNILGLMT
jgi:hypothetical protein